MGSTRSQKGSSAHVPGLHACEAACASRRPGGHSAHAPGLREAYTHARLQLGVSINNLARSVTSALQMGAWTEQTLSVSVTAQSCSVPTVYGIIGTGVCVCVCVCVFVFSLSHAHSLSLSLYVCVCVVSHADVRHTPLLPRR